MEDLKRTGDARTGESRRTPAGDTRGAFLRKAGLGGVTLVGGSAVLGGLARPAWAGDPGDNVPDVDVLNYALTPHPRYRGTVHDLAEGQLAAGFALALPIVLWQLWSYLSPAVERHLQRTISAFVGFATLLFVVGVGFGDRVALPAAVHFLTNYDNNLYNIQVRAQSYYSFALMVLVAVGVVFEVPIFVLALVRLRVISAARLRRSWRAGLAIMAVLAVALPGVDPVTTTMEMIPLMALYLLSVGLATILERRWFALPAAARASARA